MSAPLPLLDDYLLNLQVNNYSPETLYNYERDLKVFEDFLFDAQLDFQKLSKKDVLNYKAFLTSIDRKTANNNAGQKKLNAYSINRMLSSLRNYLKYLIEMDHDSPLPPDVVKMIKTTKKKPQVAEFDELVRLIEFPSKFETDNRIALRNRAMLEVLFSTGLRISELVNLKITQIDKQGRIFVLGKGKKERFVYLTPRAIIHLNDYLKTRSDSSPYAFIPYRGLNSSSEKARKISPNYLQDKITKYR
jgi:site-specific recombinase XerD